VVHLNSARAVFIAGDGPGTVAEVKDALVHPFFSEPMARLIAARYRRACQVAVPNSEFVARSLVSAGFPSERAVTVYNGLDLSSVKPLSGAERRAVRSTFNLGPSDHVVTMVGRLARWKGQDIALEAFAAYRQDSRDSHLLLLGDEAFDGRGFAAELRALTARLGISERVVFGGFVEDAWRVIGASDVALHCSRLPEPLGLTPVESQATAVPVVASAEGGVLETVEDRVTGYLFAPRDPQAAAEGLRWVDTVDAEQVGGAGRLRAEQMFDIHRTVAAYERLYEAL
jgi:glycosyltransferase involved in cell wall biosynthesis